ncbi:sigma-54-dependent Fis family transcriptional regulator [Arhodomonas sp. KWT2]|uniref:sigma-54-dependent Fis family transcriptional regulator n=3 Tax=unclassified Arhodomonas TaxID=2621637 RepID=UPI0035BF8629
MAADHANDSASLREARRRFFEGGDAGAAPVLAETVTRSWHRCRLDGLVTDARPPGACYSESELRERHAGNRRLIEAALPELETIHRQIARTNSAVILADAEGVLLHRYGDPGFDRRAQRVALSPGACWLESERGTNAIGTALAEARAVSVHGPEHFLDCNSFLTCAAAPIRAPDGRTIGLFDVSGDQPTRQLHALGLVRMAALMVENRLLETEFDDAVYVHFHPRREFLGTLGEGIAAFGPDGALLAANASALGHLGTAAGGFNGLFDAELGNAVARASHGTTLLTTRSGLQVHARVSVRGERDQPGRTVVPGTGAAADTPALHHGDDAVAACEARALRVHARGIPVLVEGETGTGKEYLAHRIHHQGPRAGGPLVVVNCAAIPDGLIESELFGYAPGAFTGARREGARGRVHEADGGTLFLDEIGEMPQALQTRLLRVLQEQRVVPVGGGHEESVDFALIAATNRDLAQCVADGTFRADLYYRLNGLRVRLPPLRERADLEALIRHMLTTENVATEPEPEFMQALREHHWPGNLRELHNVLRTAAALAEPGRPLRRYDLPDDLATPSTGEDTVSSGLRARDESMMRAAVQAHDGNVAAAARSLGISRSTLYRRLGRHPGR